MRIRAAVLAVSAAVAGCAVDDDFEPNNDVASATPLEFGGAVTATAVFDDDDFFKTEQFGLIRWHLVRTGGEMTAGLLTLGVDELRCIDEGSTVLPPPPRMICGRDGVSFDLDTGDTVVLVRQPRCDLCVDHGTTDYEIDLLPVPP